jgi:hypothetical protein
MRAVLEPVFGEGGAVVVQFILTLILVLIVVGAVVWLVRRYGSGAFGGLSRSRAPRLALVDTLAIDGRRRLVLVRRDSVEHLILLGGPTDVVVEPTIVRGISAGMRRATQAVMRSGAPQQPALAAEARPADVVEPLAAEATPADAVPGDRAMTAPPEVTIRRIPAAANSDDAAPFPLAARAEAAETQIAGSSAPAVLRRSEHVNGSHGNGDLSDTRPTRIDSVFALGGALDDIGGDKESAASAPFEPARHAGPSPAQPQAAAAPTPDDDPISEYLALGEEEPVTAIAAEEIAERLAPPPPTTRVSDLEREMARLLGEITAKRGN